MANYPQELAQDAVCQSHTGHMTGLWFLPVRSLGLNTNEWMRCHRNPPPFTLLENCVMHKAITHVLIYRKRSRILSGKDPLSFPCPRVRVVGWAGYYERADRKRWLIFVVSYVCVDQLRIKFVRFFFLEDRGKIFLRKVVSTLLILCWPCISIYLS